MNAQMSLFDFIDNPVEQNIGGAMSVGCCTDDVFSKREIMKILKRGSMTQGGKERIIRAYDDAKLNESFLKAEYGICGHSYVYSDGSHGFVDYDAKGMRLVCYCDEKPKKIVSWKEVADVLKYMIKNRIY